MNLYEKVKRFGEIISELAGLYGEMSDELPQLSFVGAPAPAKSEVKKIHKIYYFSWVRGGETATFRRV